MPDAPAARPAVEIADAGVRRRALAAETSFLVRAPAGAGKTELLVQRLLTMLATVEEPESVVAVTFTRKAAAEMRKRVLAALAAAAAAEPEAPHARHTWQLARAVAVRDSERGWNLLTTPSRLRVTTLDSLALALVARLPWSARLGAVPMPSESADDMYHAAAHAALACVEDQPPTADGEAARALLEMADGDWGYATGLLSDMLGHRDQWLAPVMQAPENLRAALEAGFTAQLEADLEEVRTLVAADPAADALVALAADADPPPESPVAACRCLRELPPARMAALPAWLGLVHLATTQEKGAARTRGDKRDGLVSKELRARLQQLSLGEDTLPALHGLRRFPRLPFEESFWTRLEALRRLLPRAVAELQVEFHARGECDFTAITLAACQALREPGSPLAYALDAQLRHLLVDEFQDTSTAHFEFLQALVQDWQPGDGRTLFLVGDPMQSIYLFRNARVDLFLRAAEGRLGGVELEVLQLSSNFRSQAGLVAWCNQKFAQVFPAREAARRGQVRFHPATSVHPEAAAAVELHVE
ncbi:MAG TPA: UvrD-helicase domain-containing protein, partial [Terriglobales bacterium]|nr:UvrD-helicase domain-containing protein [Terriglobales bacterium]